MDEDSSGGSDFAQQNYSFHDTFLPLNLTVVPQTSFLAKVTPNCHCQHKSINYI